MSKFNLNAALAKANKFRKKVTEKAGTGFDQFDDGSYIMRATKCEIGPSASSGRTQATIHWKFMEGEYRGKTFRHFQGLENEDGWTFFLRDLRAMGFDVAQIDDFETDVPKIMKEIEKEKPVCRVSLKTNGEFQNLRIRRLIDEDEVEEVDEETDDETDSEKEVDESEKETSSVKSKKVKSKKATREEKEDVEEEVEEEEVEEDAEEDDAEEEEVEEDAEEEDAEEVLALTVGSRVKVDTKSGEKSGEVLEIFEDDNAVRVKTKDGKVLRLSANKIVEVLDTPAEPKGKKHKETPSKKTRK